MYAIRSYYALEDGDFAFLEEKYLRVEVADLGLAWFLTYQQGQLQILAQAPATDVSFTAGLNDLVLIAGRKEDPDSLFFQRRLRIEGDTELGLEVKNLLDSLDLEQLPALLRRALGDLATFVQGADPRLSEQARITSYNVCYTKLLRIAKTYGLNIEVVNYRVDSYNFV